MAYVSFEVTPFSLQFRRDTACSVSRVCRCKHRRSHRPSASLSPAQGDSSGGVPAGKYAGHRRAQNNGGDRSGTVPMVGAGY